MLNQRLKERGYLHAVIDALLLALAFAIAFVVRSRVHLPFISDPEPLDLVTHVWLLSISVPLFWVLGAQSGLYNGTRRDSAADYFLSIARPFAYMSVILGTTIFVFKAKAFSRAVFFLFLIASFVLIAGVRFVARVMLRRRSPSGDGVRRVLIVGTGDEALELREKIERNLEGSLRVIGHVSVDGAGPEPARGLEVLGTLDDLNRILEDYVLDDVVFAVPFDQLLSSERSIALCEEVGVTVHLKVDFVRTLFARTFPTDFDGTPMLTVSATPRDPMALMIKHVLDLTVSMVALVVLLPVMAVAALAIRLTSSGPVFFVQQRVGLNGRLFRLYKFRSMYVDAERRRPDLTERNEMDGPVFKMKRDPRVTPVGRWLRRLSLDELPQLWNVLRGEMSLVGPRPPLASEVREYARWQRRRLSMKPGLTCLWQVGGRNRVGFDEWMKLDLAYIDNWSLSLDFKILLRTVPAVLLARGAH